MVCFWGLSRDLIWDFISSYVTQLSSCSLAAPSFASLSTFSYPGMPQWVEIQCNTLWLTLLIRCRASESLSSLFLSGAWRAERASVRKPKCEQLSFLVLMMWATWMTASTHAVYNCRKMCLLLVAIGSMVYSPDPLGSTAFVCN